MIKYEEYVSNLKQDNIKSLVIIPLIVGMVTFLAPMVFQYIYSIIFSESMTKIVSVSSALAMATTLIVAIFFMSKLDKLQISNLGISKKNIGKQVITGVLSGLLLITIVVILIVLLGSNSLKFNGNFVLSTFILGLFFFIFQGTWEELIYRAYLMPHFSKKFGHKTSIIVTSILFTLGHALNPGMQFLPILNLFIASLVFSLAYYYTGNLIVVGLAHGIWNFAQGFIFGAEVSGNKIHSSLLISNIVKGNELISGGNFGFEGGLVTTILGILLIIVFLSVIKRKKVS